MFSFNFNSNGQVSVATAARETREGNLGLSIETSRQMIEVDVMRLK